MRPLALILALLLPAAAAAQTASPGLILSDDRDASRDLLERDVVLYPGQDVVDLDAPAPEGRFNPAVPGCIGVGLPDDGYGVVPDCYAVDALPGPAREGVLD